mgnify:CR=1 FL=1
MEPIKILVIDDEPVICDGCRLTLSDQGFAVDSCNSGTNGLEILLVGEYDLALLDMKLPDMNGMEILRHLKHENPGIYVIVMTGYSSVQNAVDAMRLGAFDYITKPFDIQELRLRVRNSLQRTLRGPLTNPVTGDVIREKAYEHGLGLDATQTADFFPWGMADAKVFNVKNSAGTIVVTLLPTGIVEEH